MAIAMHDAVKIAKTEARQLFEEEETAHLMLEEVDFDAAEQAWLVTLGYDSHLVVKTTRVPEEATTSFDVDMLQSVGGEIIEERKPRVYKVFRIDAADGRLISMKMRDV
ncbi:hypothetical protein [Candidatus Electronema sp. TJ]|uniref:hypothetical protein n=1 Tax=Candidatus Electronema sp. TJ TaxID=3401573 RepID=UPI003AA9B24D